MSICDAPDCPAGARWLSRWALESGQIRALAFCTHHMHHYMPLLPRPVRTLPLVLDADTPASCGSDRCPVHA